MQWTRFLTPALALLLAAPSVFAQGSNTAAAEALFQEGRTLYEQGKYAQACPKLAASQRLDAGMGTLLLLALCHEAEGKFASAWSEFTTVEGQARQAGRADREKVAREHAAALRPRLSTLTIEVPPAVAQTQGLEVKVDGAVMAPGSFGVAIPVDGGEHRIEASAPGKQPFSSAVTVKRELDTARAAVPQLADAPSQAPAGPAAPMVATGPAPTASPSRSGKTLRTAGLITAGAGVVALGVGSYLALDAKSDYSSARDQCDDTCPPGPHDDIESARSQGTVATIAFAAGGALLATGAVLWLMAPSETEAGVPAAAGLHLERVGVGPTGVLLQGGF